MAFLSRKDTYDSYTPSTSSSRTSGNGPLYRKSSKESIQSYRGSISNSSVHTNSTAATRKDLLDKLGKGSDGDSSNSDPKSLHAFEKPTLGFRNQSQYTEGTIREAEFDSNSTPPSTPHISVHGLSKLPDPGPRESHKYDLPPVESSPQSTSAALTSSTSSNAEVYSGTRVRALHSFEPTEPNELAFEKGDVIRVVNREYKDWWQGRLRGYTGVFPVNYVEPLPEPTPAELAAEAQQEDVIFSQMANVDQLLTMLRTLDPAKDNLADNEEIQELYLSYLSLRPKIVKLINKYSQKHADLVSMDESFVKARTIFDRMMEESIVRHIHVQQRQAPPPYPELRVPGQQAPGYGPYGQPADQPQAVSIDRERMVPYHHDQYPSNVDALAHAHNDVLW